MYKHEVRHGQHKPGDQALGCFMAVILLAFLKRGAYFTPAIFELRCPGGDVRTNTDSFVQESIA